MLIRDSINENSRSKNSTHEASFITSLIIFYHSQKSFHIKFVKIRMLKK